MFLLAVLVFQITPGPGTVVILTASAKGGMKAGLGAVFGTLCGDMMYMIPAVFKPNLFCPYFINHDGPCSGN